MKPRPLIGLIGENISRSLSPALHDDAFAAHGLQGHYHLIEFRKDDRRTLAAALDAVEMLGFLGVNITHPFKELVIPFLSGVGEDAARAGAVNTVVFGEDGTRTGHNTDLSGFRAAVKMELGADAVQGQPVLLLGAGGAGRAVAFALADLGAAEILVSDPNRERSQALCDLLNAAQPGRARAVEAAEVAAEVAGMVNASNIGMTGYPGCPIDPALLRAHHWVADVIYTPLETELLAHARALGCRRMNGAAMCVMQAVDAFRHFTGLEADVPRMLKAFERAAAERDRLQHGK